MQSTTTSISEPSGKKFKIKIGVRECFNRSYYCHCNWSFMSGCLKCFERPFKVKTENPTCINWSSCSVERLDIDLPNRAVKIMVNSWIYYAERGISTVATPRCTFGPKTMYGLQKVISI
ncbi:hypothetical protein CDAR_411901 [Caerostris darwini]|uniref:Uncharacterized protein n=1 Tax=Caerostris darwini TaxID=1538125 RepID=A0AAV4WEG5_9ARAC|nr:hypothetical protein CDAR_411901 [Caerostris darwini]